jgi:hypothetical protein
MWIAKFDAFLCALNVPTARLSAMKSALVALAFLADAGVASSQEASLVAEPTVVVGTDEENYLRYLQAAGKIGRYPWSLRGFSPLEMRRLATPKDSSPWAPRLPDAHSGRRFEAHFLPVDGSLRFNSAFPYGSNDGAIWAGRGVTFAVSGGFVVLFGPVSAVIAPVAFHAQNSGFTLMPTGGSGPLQFAEPVALDRIDLPQRFGDAGYGRFDPGQSTLRVDLLGVTAGFSSANMGWGPMHTYQYVLGANAPGIPHIFLGTSSPPNVWFGRLHGRAIWGVLEQSEYSPVQGSHYYSSIVESGTRRFATGLVATFEPRGLPGLELGWARFFHLVWPRGGPPQSYFTRVFESILKRGLTASPDLTDTLSKENQLASAFARWVFPQNGFEVYGEYAREDHNYDTRDLLQEPDHSRSYGLGFRKIVRADSRHLSAFRAELINYQFPTLARHRIEGGIYGHVTLRQGHTNRGQILGADAGVWSGAASTLALDRYTPRGRTTLSFQRTVRRESGMFFVDGTQDARSRDVQVSLSADQVRFLSRVELTTGATLVRELNRHFQADAWNVNALIGVRFHPSKK